MVFTFFITLLVFCLVIVAFLTFLRPSYRIQASQIVVLFDAVLGGRANTQDWLVFTAVPIRYDDELESIRGKCLALEELHFLGDASRFLFDSVGLAALVELKKELLVLQHRSHL